MVGANAVVSIQNVILPPRSIYLVWVHLAYPGSAGVTCNLFRRGAPPSFIRPEGIQLGYRDGCRCGLCDYRRVILAVSLAWVAT